MHFWIKIVCLRQLSIVKAILGIQILSCTVKAKQFIWAMREEDICWSESSRQLSQSYKCSGLELSLKMWAWRENRWYKCHLSCPGLVTDIINWSQHSFLMGLNPTLENFLIAFEMDRASLVVQTVKNLPPMQETWVWSLGWEDPRRRKWQPTPVFWPGESPRTEKPWGHKESDMTEWLSSSNKEN